MARQSVVVLLSLLVVLNAKAASVPEALTEEEKTQYGDEKVHQDAINLFGFSIIRNSTQPCHKISENGKNQYRFHPLTNDDKLAILEIKGGRFMKEYMAKDDAGARESFPCLLDLDFNFEDKKLHPIWKPKWKWTKAAIQHQLHREAMEEERLATEPPMSVRSSESGKTTEDTKKEKGDGSENDVSTHRNATGVNKKKEKDGAFVRPEDIGLPNQITDEDSGDVSRLEMCLTRGTRTRENTHLYMCTTCSATTNLGEKYWPSIINEARCIEADPYCFIVDMIPHGVCKQKIIPMKVLQKKAGYCALGLKNGETVIVEEWTTIERAVHMGCECVIDVNSYYARYVGRYEN